MIEIAFRLDDPSQTSNHPLEREILAILQHHDCPATLAVIPFKRDHRGDLPLHGDQIPHLVDAARERRIEIALHGYTHAHCDHLQGPPWSEFDGLAGERQQQIIQAGKNLLGELFSTPVHGFVPPWNSFDQTTLEVLSRLGFRYLSADWNVPARHSGIVLLPHTCNLQHTKEAIAEARRLRNLSPRIVIILHHYDFAEHSGGDAPFDLAGLDALLAWIRRQPDLRLLTLAEMAQSLDPDHCLLGCRHHAAATRLHWRLARLYPRYTLVTATGSPLFSGLLAYGLTMALGR